MRVIITGGTGLIGQALSSAIVKDGHDVFVLSRAPQRAHHLSPQVNVVQWDAQTANGWGCLINSETCIVNLAGENLSAGRWTTERKRRILESRLNVGRAVVEAVAATKSKPRVLIQASAVGIYGPHDEGTVSEQTPPGDDTMARVAIAWEASTQAVEDQGVRRVIIRSGIVLSRNGGALPRLVLPFRLFIGGRLGTGDQGFSWIHIADEVAAIRFLIANSNAHGPINLTAPNPLTNQAFARTLGKVLKRPSFIPVPAFALRIVFGEMADVLLKGQRAVPESLLSLGYTFHFPDATSALQDLVGKHIGK